MLRLDVAIGQTVEIGDNIVLSLEKKSGQRARLAIKADPNLKIILKPSLQPAEKPAI